MHEPDDSDAVLVERWVQHGATREEAQGLVEGNVLSGHLADDWRVLCGYRAGVAWWERSVTGARAPDPWEGWNRAQG